MTGFTATQTAAAYDATLYDSRGGQLTEKWWDEYLPVDSQGHANVTSAVAAIVKRVHTRTIDGRPAAGIEVALQGQGMAAGFTGWTTTGWALSLNLTTRVGITETAAWVGGDPDALDILRDLWRAASS